MSAGGRGWGISVSNEWGGAYKVEGAQVYSRGIPSSVKSLQNYIFTSTIHTGGQCAFEILSVFCERSWRRDWWPQLGETQVGLGQISQWWYFGKVKKDFFWRWRLQDWKLTEIYWPFPLDLGGMFSWILWAYSRAVEWGNQQCPPHTNYHLKETVLEEEGQDGGTAHVCVETRHVWSFKERIVKERELVTTQRKGGGR